MYRVCSCFLLRDISSHPTGPPWFVFGSTILNNHQVEDLAVSSARFIKNTEVPTKKAPKCRNVYFYVGRRVLILRCLQSKEPTSKRCGDVVLPEPLYYSKIEQTNQTCKMLTIFSAIHLNTKNLSITHFGVVCRE